MWQEDRCRKAGEDGRRVSRRGDSGGVRSVEEEHEEAGGDDGEMEIRSTKDNEAGVGRRWKGRSEEA